MATRCAPTAHGNTADPVAPDQPLTKGHSVKDKKTDGAALLLTEVFNRAAKQQKAKTERDEFRRQLRTEETD
jgi:hypothetical protein